MGVTSSQFRFPSPDFRPVCLPVMSIYLFVLNEQQYYEFLRELFWHELARGCYDELIELFAASSIFYCALIECLSCPRHLRNL